MMSHEQGVDHLHGRHVIAGLVAEIQRVSEVAIRVDAPSESFALNQDGSST